MVFNPKMDLEVYPIYVKCVKDVLRSEFHLKKTQCLQMISKLTSQIWITVSKWI